MLLASPWQPRLADGSGSASERLVEALACDIADGSLPPGARLPPGLALRDEDGRDVTPAALQHGLVLDLAQANGPDDRMVLIATEPLTRNEPWRPFAAGELRVFEAGEEVWRHTPARREAPAAHFAARLVAA